MKRLHHPDYLVILDEEIGKESRDMFDKAPCAKPFSSEIAIFFTAFLIALGFIEDKSFFASFTLNVFGNSFA